MGSGFLNYRPSPEEVPISPLWLRPTAALGRISCRFSPAADMCFPLPSSDKPHYVDSGGVILTMGVL